MAVNDVSVVLAHGAWADGSSWAQVITALKAEGASVSAAPLPLTSLADDVAALNRSLDRTEGPIVLAGHAYAGAVIALARPERVKALVYVTALAPDEGEKVADVFYRLEPHPQAPKLAPDSNGVIWLPEEAFAAAFAQNASAHEPRKRGREGWIELASINARRQQPENAGASSRLVASVPVKVVGAQALQDPGPVQEIVDQRIDSHERRADFEPQRPLLARAEEQRRQRHRQHLVGDAIDVS